VPVTYIVFDILEKDGKALVDLPLTERRKILESAVTEGPHITRSVPVAENGEDYYRAAIARGLEGVMAKRKDSRYEPGVRSDTWLKIKAEKTCDCIIAGYTTGSGRRSPFFGALILALYDTGNTGMTPALRETRSVPGELVYIGKVGTGFTERDLAALKTAFTSLKTGKAQATGTETGDTITWLEPALVGEVAYQEVTRDGKLRIPRFVRLRPEKKPEECTTDQLFPVKTSPVTNTSDERKAKSNLHRRHLPEQLTEYQSKRDFSVTGEPEGETMTEEGNYFVIHEHHSHKLHFDLRLERDGVLKSWAVPKGIPTEPGEKHLAVAVEDHPLEYGHFEGTIPKGQYGAGTVSIWDNGTYDTKLWDSKKIEIIFHGKRLNGSYVLVPFKRAGKDEWLVFQAGK
jgi:DNA ligase D-like protein (predicted 3'-phosphoesterase)